MASNTEKMELRKHKKPNTLTTDVQSPTMGAFPYTMASTDSKFRELNALIIKKFNELEDRLMGRINTISDNLESLRSEVSGAILKIGAVDNQLKEVVKDVVDLRAKVQALENAAVSSDLIMHGVPNEADGGMVARSLVDVLKCKSVLICDAFRVGQCVGGKCRPVIIKLSSPLDRVTFLKSLASFRKGMKRQLKCCDIGLTGNGAISIFESLTGENRNIMQAALRYKNDKKLHSVFSLRGSVFVRLKPDDVAKKIPNMNVLVATIGVAI